MGAREVADGVGGGFRLRPARDVGLVWIVCLQATRDVAASQVKCPLGGRAPIRRCLDCRLLQAVEYEWHLAGCGPWPG